MAGQRLVNVEIDDRVIIKLDKSIKQLDKGINGLMTFGQLNDYPQIIEKLINGSVTAKASASIYSKFLTGQGFENEAINNIKVGIDSRGKEITVKSLLRQVSDSVSYNYGFYIHLNPNREGKIEDVHIKPFKMCRFAKSDDTGYSAKIIVSNKWGEKNARMKVEKDYKDFNVFNLDEKVLVSQINKAGGIENYKGQIYFQFLDNQFFYPLSPFDAAYLDCDTENQISLFKNRQLRNGMLKKTIFSIAPEGDEQDKEEFVKAIKNLMGPDGDSSMVIETEINPETNQIDKESAIKIDQIDNNIDDKLFENWEKGLANSIRKAIRGIPAILIDYEENKLGSTSGEAIIQATNFYNALTNDDRDLISQSFEDIFKHSVNPILAENTNWKIKPLNLIEQQQDGTTNTDTTAGD